MTNRKRNIEIGVDVDTEQLQDAADIIKEAGDLRPNITIRNNENIWITINNYKKDEY